MNGEDKGRLGKIEVQLRALTARLNALVEGNLEIVAEGHRIGSTRLLEKLWSATGHSDEYHLYQRDSGGTESDLTGARSIQGIPVSETDPTTTQILGYNATTNQYEPTAAGAAAAHAAQHQNGGADEPSVTGLSGLLADDQHVLDAEVLSAVEGEATLDLTGDVTIAASKSLSVDTIAEKTGAAGVTVDGVLIKDSGIPDGVKGVTKIVAANDASADMKAYADYICDGTADEVQIQAAIDALPAFSGTDTVPIGGGRVLLTEGRFYINAAIDITDDFMTLQGQGPSTKLYAATNMTDHIIKTSGSTPVYRIQIRDLFIQGNAAASGTYHGILVDGMYDALISNVTIVQAKAAGIYGDGNTKAFEMIKIENSRFQACGTSGVDLHNGDLNIIRGNAFLQNAASGLALVSADSSIVMGNSSDSNVGNGYSFSVVTNLVCIGNWSFNDNDGGGNAAIEVYPPFAQGLISNNFVMSSNKTALRLGTLTGGSADIDDLICTGNVVSNADTSYYAILIDGAGTIENSLVAHNSVANNTNTFSVTVTNRVNTPIKNNPGYVSSDDTTLEDADGDTKVQVEEGADDDTWRVDCAGNEELKCTDTQFTCTPNADFSGGVDVTGNITVTGTVDNVDIAARDHAESHNIASHNDTTATGTELETLTDGSDADSLHDHATFVTGAEAIAAVEGEATLALAGDVTIAGDKSLSVDVINEKDANAGVTIDTVLIKDGLVDGYQISGHVTMGTGVHGVGMETILHTGTGAKVALDNLASVAINTSLVSDGDNTDDLGATTTGRWKDLYLAGNLTDDTNTLTVANAKAAYDHVSADGSGHGHIDQDVTSGSTPTFTGTNFTGIPSAGVTDNVSASAVVTDHTIVRGHGGAKVVQDTSITVDDSDNVASMGTLGCGAVTSSGVVIGTTIEPTGDTSAGDNSALGYTAAEGAILTGQGSTSDVTVKNDADAEVLSVPTGTTEVHFATHVHIDSTPADDSATGITTELTAGINLAWGDFCYVGADGKMEKALATAEATSRVVAFCTETVNENATGTFLLQGFIRDDDGLEYTTIGARVYLSDDTAGDADLTQPAGEDECIVILGIALATRVLYFNPIFQAIVEHEAP